MICLNRIYIEKNFFSVNQVFGVGEYIIKFMDPCIAITLV